MILLTRAGKARLSSHFRSYATAVQNSADGRSKILVIGGGRCFALLCIQKYFSLTGSGGLSIANQLYNRFNAAGKQLKDGDITILDAAEYHYYQVCACVRTYLTQN